MRTLISISVLLPIASAADTCLSQGQLGGIIAGSVLASLLMCTLVAIVLWKCVSRDINKKTQDKSAYTNPACDVEEKGCDAPVKLSQKDQMTMIDSFTLRRKQQLDMSTQKSFSHENINEVDGQVGVLLDSDNLGGFGFNIVGNMNEGIFIHKVHPKGQADQSGNIKQGDRIKSLTIVFEGMVCEDAITLLSYASPYKVKLELERKLQDEPTNEDSVNTSPRIHPLFRSNTLTNCHFNPVSPTTRCPSLETTQKHALPISPQPEVTSSESSETDKIPQPDSTSSWPEIVSEVSKMESSDYASDNTSDYRDSMSDKESLTTSNDMSAQTISDCMEITEIVSEKPIISPPPAVKMEFCTTLPPKPRKVVSRSPSPKVVAKPPSPAPTPPAHRKTPTPVQSPPTPEPVKPEPSAIPVKREPSKTKMTPPSPRKAPEIMEARVSRIPKRTESIKTPILERKLPTLPKSVTQRSHSAENKQADDTVWSRLYQEKKGTLRKTRDPSAPSTTGTSHRVQRAASNEKYGTLSRERKDRLQANQDTLDRQKEELRQLGVL